MRDISNGTTAKYGLKRTLLAGPWVGELGTELFCWQGYLRSIAHRYSEIKIIGKPGHKILYEDFCDEYLEYDPPKDGLQAVEIHKRKFYKDILKFVRTISYDTWVKPYPIEYNALNRDIVTSEFTGQKFITYQSNSFDKKYDIIVHARNKSIDSFRNWDKEKWQTLIDLLIKDFTVASIGGEESHAFDNIDNYKNLPLNDVVSLMNRCKLVVGPISGPIHLAALSNTEHLVWAASEEIMKCDNRWNPFGITCYFHVINDYDPDLNEIYNYIKQVMKTYEK